MQERFTHPIKAVAGISAIVALLGFGLVVRVGGHCCPSSALAAERAGEPSNGKKSVTLAVEGMTCGACSVAVKTALKKLDGVKDASVSYADKRAVVEYDPTKVTPNQMVEAVTKLGYKASIAS